MFVTLILLAILGLIATDIFAPSLPSIGMAFGQSLNHTELTMSLFLVGFAFSQLFYGPISDKTGRKGPLLFGVILFMIGSLCCVLAQSFLVFCIGSVLQGIAVGSGLSIARVILRDLYNGVELAVKSSQMAIFVSLTPAVAPFIGGLFQESFGFRSIFVFLFLYGLLLLFLMLFVFKETIRHKEPSLNVARTIGHYQKMLSNFGFIHYVFIAGIAFSTIILYANMLPFIIQEQMHLSAKVNGMVLLFAALGISIASFISSKIVHRVSPGKLLHIGLYCLTVSGILLVVLKAFFGLSLIILMPCLFLATLACGFTFPNALALAFSQVSVNIGVAGALYGCIQISLSMIMNFLLNMIPDQGQALLGIFYILLGLLGLSLLSFKKSVAK